MDNSALYSVQFKKNKTHRENVTSEHQDRLGDFTKVFK